MPDSKSVPNTVNSRSSVVELYGMQHAGGRADVASQTGTFLTASVNIAPKIVPKTKVGTFDL